MYYALRYTQTSPLQLGADYPYVTKKQTCKYVASKGLVKALTITNLPSSNPDSIKAAVNKGPVSVAV